MGKKNSRAELCLTTTTTVTKVAFLPVKVELLHTSDLSCTYASTTNIKFLPQIDKEHQYSCFHSSQEYEKERTKAIKIDLDASKHV